MPREVTRAVFRGRRYPTPGRFLSYADAFRLRDALREYFEGPPYEPPPLPPELPPAPPAPLEWEVGIDYEAGDRTSNVEFNARIFRADGGRLTEEEARIAFGEMVWTGEAPPGIVVREVWWRRRKNAGKRYGRVGHLEGFRNIVSRVGETGMHTVALRFGAVKPEGL